MGDIRDRLHALDRVEAPDLWREAGRRRPRPPMPDGPSGGRRAIVLVVALALALALGLGSVALLVRAFPGGDGVAPADPTPTDTATKGAPALILRCDGPATEVSTPTVAAQPDGVHVELAKAIGTQGLAFFPEGDGVMGTELDGTETVIELPVGPGRVACLDRSNSTGDSREELATSVPYLVVDPAGNWHRDILDCPRDHLLIDDGGRLGAWSGVNPFDTDLPEVIRRAVPGILPTDTVDLAGYPSGDRRMRRMRVVRDGEVIALIPILGSGDVVHFSPESCEGSGIGRSDTAGMLATPFEIDGYPRCDPYKTSCALAYLMRPRYEALGGAGAPSVTFTPGATLCLLDGMVADCGPHPDTTQIFALRMSPEDATAFVHRYGCGATFADPCE